MHKKFDVNRTKIKGGCQWSMSILYRFETYGHPCSQKLSYQKINDLINRLAWKFCFISFWSCSWLRLKVSSDLRFFFKTFPKAPSLGLNNLKKKIFLKNPLLFQNIFSAQFHQISVFKEKYEQGAIGYSTFLRIQLGK